jgi:DNA polymerase-3 subunit delta
VSQQPELEPVYLITGSDQPKVELAVTRLRRRFAAEATERVSALECTGVDAVGLCNAPSLFGEGRLVVVTDVDGRRSAEGRPTGGWKAADVSAVVEYLEAPAPLTTLALVASEIRKDSPLAKACARAGRVLEFAVSKRSVATWVAERFRQQGVQADPDACAALVHLVGDDLRALAVEVDKVATWAGDDPVTEQEIETLVAGVADTPPFAITDAWAKRDAGGALEATERIFDRSDRPRRDEAARLSATLSGHAARLRTARRLRESGVRAADALSQLGTRSAFYAGKLYDQSDEFSASELGSATVRLAELDLALKGGSRLAPDLELQRALLEISRDRSAGSDSSERRGDTPHAL